MNLIESSLTGSTAISLLSLNSTRDAQSTVSNVFCTSDLSNVSVVTISYSDPLKRSVIIASFVADVLFWYVHSMLTTSIFGSERDTWYLCVVGSIKVSRFLGTTPITAGSIVIKSGFAASAVATI